ncbi:hypothetical protein ACS0TY_006530 [Phlomoides rotata]
MGTEVEHASGDIQSTVTTPPSTTSTSAPKTSMFAKRSGFVIPKNKLSGSLVRVHKGTKKGDADLMNEEANKQVHRKTKWGPDLNMDTTVRKGRALAYQTRINQISQQLTLGMLELEDNDESFAASESRFGKTSDQQLSHEESALLELERREIIGELLKLNPTYKAPADYKPLLKEAKVPIPIKEYPGYNFVGLLFGHSSDTLKRLEKETGAKVQVYGTKKDTGGKVEITPSDGNEIENTCEDMYVHVSADTFEKVDAAVALIELLLTPVSVNPVSSSTTSTSVPNNNVNAHPSQGRPSSLIAPPLINQGIAQPYAGSLSLSQGHFQQYPQPWFSAGPAQTPTYPQSGFKPSNVPSLFGPQPGVAASFSPVFQNPSAPLSGNQPPFMQQAPPLVQTGGPRNTSMPVLPSPTTQPSLQGPPYSSRPPMSISPQFAPAPASSGPMTAQVPSHGHNIMALQKNLSPMNIPNRMISPLSGPPQASGAVANQQSRGGFSPSESTHSIGPVQSANAAARPAPMPFPMQSSAPPPQPRFPNSISGNVLSFDPVRPVSAAISRPSSSDFTFQPHRPPNAAASPLWQGNHSIRHPVQGQASLAPQPPLLRPMVHNMNPSPVQDGFSRPQVNQPMAQIPTNFSGNQPRHHPMMPGPTVPHMQPRNFIPPHQINPFPPRPGSRMHIQDNHHAGPAHPPRFPIPQQHFGNHLGRPFFNTSGTQQTYDPFSPTSPSRGR